MGQVGNRPMWVASALLALLGLLYVANGLHTLLAPGLAGDLGMRWRERGYLARGVDPYDVSVQFNGIKPTAAELERITARNLAAEAPTLPSGYPPWGLAASFLLVAPGSLTTAQASFAALSLAALAVCLAFAFQIGRRRGSVSGFFLAACTLAMFGNASTLRVGQYGLILNASLLLAFWLAERGNKVVAGIVMSVAAAKPSFSILQFGVLLLRAQWLVLAAVAGVCLAATGLAWHLTGVDPLEMTKQMLVQSAAVTQGDTGLLGVTRLLLGQSSAVSLLGVVGILLTAIVAWSYRRETLLVSASVAAVIGRLCTYHRQYDNVMLLLPLLALGAIALGRNDARAWSIFAIFGATLWIPIPLSAYNPVTVTVLSIVWVIGCFHILSNAPAVPTFSQEVPGWSAVPAGRS